MAEYTPTADEVRERFIDGAINRAKVTGFSVTLYIRNKARADFDRWLAEVRREAAEKALRDAADDPVAEEFLRALPPAEYGENAVETSAAWLRRRAGGGDRG